MSVVIRCLFLFSFYLLALRSLVVGFFFVPFSQALAAALITLAFSLATRRNPLLTLSVFFALLPLLQGLKMLGIMPALSLLELSFAGIYLAWLPGVGFGFARVEERPVASELERLVDWLGLMVVLSLLTTLLQYPPAEAWRALSHRVSAGQLDRFWDIEGAAIFLQGLAFFRIYLHESKGREQVSRKYFQAAFVLHLSTIFIFVLIQGFFSLPTTRNLISHQALHSPFEDLHSAGSVLGLYLFALAGTLRSLQKKRVTLVAVLVVIPCFCRLSNFVSG
ncbi:MAG TPA: hypothetical protein ENN66_11295 [Proteobacteria bacterium]|nr:hypothetical protein [Pseudomonadota bacterium]